MASVNYGMGQLRFNSGFQYLTSKKNDTNPSYTSVKPTESGEVSVANCWRDYVMNVGASLSTDTTYLLHISIPKDENYDCDFNVKLVTADADLNTQMSGYQIIRYLHVPSAGDQQKNSRVILYPVKAGSEYTPWQGTGEKAEQPRVAIVRNYKKYQEEPTSYNIGDVFYNEQIGNNVSGDSVQSNTGYAVMLENGSGNLPAWNEIPDTWKIVNKNDTVLNWIWEVEEHSTEAVDFSIIFKPKANNYQKIWVEMSRTGIDWDIFDGISIGRTIDFSNSNFKAELFTLTELTTDNVNSPLPQGLVNIGLNSHPNLLFAINGEEIRVGQSGYYELNDFDIESFNIAAIDREDYFVLDYQYKIVT